jgi:EpsI family protein
MSSKAGLPRVSASFRIGIVALALVAATLYLSKASRAEEIPPRSPLDGVPMQIDGWQGRREPDFSPEIMAILGADDYIVRSYFRGTTDAVGLYVGYHASQRQGDTIHSPLNCLPGAGWQPVGQSRTVIDVTNAPGIATAPVEINRVIIEKGLDRQLVFYWYQSHRRVVASEYWGKVYTVLDSVRYNRTDAALVRVIAPLRERDKVEDVETTTVKFIQSIFPLLEPHLPS